ncbi:MAG: AAA family ATPase, partial [Deltaproteobacteria bacterium]|nr:AAA family ATPase [Deltaproteobacteria bacterium]
MKVDSIKIKNFKCLKNINTSLRNLTLIAGVNSSGKSSFIQAFLLFKENISTLKSLTSIGYEKLEAMGFNVTLNSGEYTELGYKKQLLTHDSSDD